MVEKDVPISSEWVGTLVGYINAQIRARVGGGYSTLDGDDICAHHAASFADDATPRP